MAVHLSILALASAFSPVLLAIVLVALATPEPHTMLLWYLAGGGLVSLVAGSIIMVALESLDLTRHRGSHQFGPGVDIAIGCLGIGLAIVLAVRRRRRTGSGERATPASAGRPSPVKRLLSKSSPRGMFILGLILGFPGVYYLAALKDIAQDDPNWGPRIALMVAFNVVAFVLIWVPLGAYLVAPDATRRTVAGANAWLGTHLMQIGIVVLAGVGVYEIVRGVIAL